MPEKLVRALVLLLNFRIFAWVLSGNNGNNVQWAKWQTREDLGRNSNLRELSRGDSKKMTPQLIESPMISHCLNLARKAANFLERVTTDLSPGHKRLFTSSSSNNLISMQYGVVYAAVGHGTIQKASVSATSVRRIMDNSVGTLLVTSDFGLHLSASQALFYGQAYWWDFVASVDGLGMNFTSLPEFEAFTIADPRIRNKGNSLSATIELNRKKERERRSSKVTAWAAVRQLRSAKMVALRLALETFGTAAIFLDADTLVCDPAILISAFQMVSDEGPWFAFVTAPSEHHRPMLGRMFGILKGGDIPEPNTGVMAVSSCDGSRRVLRRWSEVYWHESLALSLIQNPMDQPALRTALFLEVAPWIALQGTLNCRGHIKNLNAPLPLRCGGYDASHWKVITQSSILDAVGTTLITAASIKAVDGILGGRGCTVLHSHAIPRFTEHRAIFQRNALILMHRLLGFGLDELARSAKRGDRKTTQDRHTRKTKDAHNSSVPQERVAVFSFAPQELSSNAVVDTATDWRRGRWRNVKVIVGSMAKDACATESRACALIIVIMDPLTQLAADNESPKAIDPSILEERLRNHAKATVLGGNTLLDALLPLRIDELERHNDPRAARVKQFGPGNKAEVADAISRLETDTYLILLASEKQKSIKLLNSVLESRPDAILSAREAVMNAAMHDAKGRKILSSLDSRSIESLRHLLINDNQIYDVASTLFDEQCEALWAGPVDS